MRVRPLKIVGQAAGALLLSAMSVCAEEPYLLLLADGATPAAVDRTTPLLLDEPSPQTPIRPQDEAAELGLNGDAADEVEAAEEEADDELATLLGPEWHQCGCITGEYFYIGEVFTNTRGGISTKGATKYRGNLDVELSLDTETAGWWRDGLVYVYFQQSQGRTLTSQYVGDGQFYSNIDTSPKPQWLTQLGEYWYQHTFGNDDELVVRLGRLDPNNDFAYADLGWDFINSSFVTLPNIPMPYWPFQQLGVTALYQPHDRLRLGGGAYDTGRDVGQWWVSTTNRGMFFIGQADYMPFADCETAPLTIFRGGAWFSTADTEAVDGAGVFGDNYGFYTTLDRMLWYESSVMDQGLGAFFQFCWAPPDRNQVEQGIGAGLVYTGLVEGRDADICGSGFSLIEFSPQLEAQTGQDYENAIEFFYKARLNDWLALTADLQYIASPSGLYSDAMVVGTRFEMSL